ncbi:MAG: DUF1295 domain-containing protein, partial [Chloroflexota bacterium]
MVNIVNIAIGVCGFLIIHLFDFVSLKRIPVAKPLVWILGSSLLVHSLVSVSFTPDKPIVLMWSTLLGWILLITSLILLIHSLFVSLPFRKTYIATGVSDRLKTTGLYALVRHPGVICFSLFMLSLILVSSSSLILIAAPIFILLDIVLVVVQDKFFFGRMFNGYGIYRQKTPMLVPNLQSINNFINSLRQDEA